MDDSRSEFDATDLQLLEQARLETEQLDAQAAAALAAANEAGQADGTIPAAPAPAPQVQLPAPPAPVAAPVAPPVAPPVAAAPTPAPAATPPAADKPPAGKDADAGGSVKAALRHSRHREQQLARELARAQEALQKAGIKPDVSSTAKDPVDDSQLEDVRAYAPDVAKRMEALAAENAALKAASSSAGDNADGFVPKQFHPDIQAEIDENPDLLLWQNSPDPEHQRLFAAAERAHDLLWTDPAFQTKPTAERFAAAVNLVKTSLRASPTSAPTEKTLQDAQRVIEQTLTTAPMGARTVGDLKGGAPATHNPFRDPREMAKAGLSDESIIAALPVLP